MFTVYVWTCPDSESCDDNIHADRDFETLEAALAAFISVDQTFPHVAGKWIRVEIQGDMGRLGYLNSVNAAELTRRWVEEFEREEAYYASMARAERGMLAGMEGGCRVYNDATGWEVD